MEISERHDLKGAATIARKLNSISDIEQAISDISRKDGSNWTGPKEQFLNSLACKSWATNCNLDKQLKITLSAVKGGTAVAFQTGNIARAGYDILKLSGLYGAGKIDVAVFVAPMQAINGSSNKTFFERVSREAEFLTRAHSMPLLILGISD